MSIHSQFQSVGHDVERSGTGLSRAGLTVEKSGTGIDAEKSGTGIDVEKSGTGRRFLTTGVFLVALALAFPVIASDVSVGLVEHHDRLAFVGHGDAEMLVGSSAGHRGYYMIPVYSVPLVGTLSEGSGSGTTSEGSGSGTTSEGSGSGTAGMAPCSGTTSEGSGSGTTSEGSGSGTLSEGSGSGTLSEGSGSGTTSEGSGSGTTSESCGSDDRNGLVFWGFAEVLTSPRGADVILHRERDGQLIEHSVHPGVQF